MGSTTYAVTGTADLEVLSGRVGDFAIDITTGQLYAWQ
jgi:hypothetical protein